MVLKGRIKGGSVGIAGSAAALRGWACRYAPLVLMLPSAVIVSSLCVLWFMSEAINNDQLAMRQRLIDIYRQRMAEVRHRVDSQLDVRYKSAAAFANMPAPQAFKAIVSAKIADSCVLLDGEGGLGYPQPIIAGEYMVGPLADEFTNAFNMEFGSKKYTSAAAAYGDIAAGQMDMPARATAMRAQLRCLLKSGENTAARHLLDKYIPLLYEGQYFDNAGRLVLGDFLLLAIELAEADEAADAEKLSELQASLTKLTGDYSIEMPVSQRLFLLSALAERAAPEDKQAARLLTGEQIASDYLLHHKDVQPASGDAASDNGSSGVLIADNASGLLHVRVGDNLILLYRQLPVDLASLESQVVSEAGMLCTISDSRDEFALVCEPLSSCAGGFWISVRPQSPDSITQAIASRRFVYMTSAAAAVMLIATLSLLVGRHIARQMRLTRLKNDLIATVSHELKTPLSSMRLLIDTLREQRISDGQQASEYFGMIASENERLTRLIDNFLSFSRMERNKQIMRFSPQQSADIIRSAVDAVSDRFDGDSAKIELDIESDLPEIYGDRDSLVTVLVNLLDNAWKYSGDSKLVRLRAFSDGDSVLWQLSDNGIGMTRSQQRRIFDRFYQADNSLSRSTSGCGLGLSIVKFILDSHAAGISVKSQLGTGSVFTVTFQRYDKNKGEALDGR